MLSGFTYYTLMETVMSTTPSNGALRYDTGKTDWSLLPWDGLKELANHYTRGAEKYSARNWELGMKYSRCYNSLQRHLNAWWMGEDYDMDASWKCLHLVAVVWNAMALLVYTLRGVGQDDRPVFQVAPTASPQPCEAVVNGTTSRD